MFHYRLAKVTKKAKYTKRKTVQEVFPSLVAITIAIPFEYAPIAKSL